MTASLRSWSVPSDPFATTPIRVSSSAQWISENRPYVRFCENEFWIAVWSWVRFCLPFCLFETYCPALRACWKHDGLPKSGSGGMNYSSLPNSSAEEAGDTGTEASSAGGGRAEWNSGVMVGQETKASAGEGKFPNVLNKYWRSSHWNSHSAPPGSKVQPLPLGDREQVGTGRRGPADHAVPLTPRSQQQHQVSKARASLPPLQPLSISRKSLDEWPKAGQDDMADWGHPATPGRRRVKTGPEIKLDLASVQRNSAEPTEIQLKRDKFARFDKECSRVADYHIYLGSDAVARNRETLRANGITHVLNCVGFVCPEYFKRDLVYKTLWLQDSPCEDITSLLYDVFDYFEEVGEQGGRVFVHCCQGVSRSTSLVIAYMMWREGRSFEDAFQDVKAARGVTNPNMGFACQLLQCQKRVAAPMSPNSMLRMYRIAPHSPYDPLHLVPKSVNDPGAGALDSRGAFVIHVPRAIYVWTGLNCDPKIAQAAMATACQVVRYERAQGSVLPFQEGQEDPEFWESLSKDNSFYVDEVSSAGRASVEEARDGGLQEVEPQLKGQRSLSKLQVEEVWKLGIGNKRVPSYTVDFELYQWARQGVVPPVPFTGVGVAAVPTRLPAREDGWSKLRRKFLSGELVPPKETGKIDKTVQNSPSPNTSCSSSSPHLSPFSANSSSSPARSSSSPHLSPFSANSSSSSSSSPASKDSPHASPLSLASNVSKSTLQANSPCSSQASSSPDSGNCNSFPSVNSPALPANNTSPYANQSGSKTPSTSLAQRRGSVSPCLRLPGLEDDPPPAPRGMSRKPRLPPLMTAAKSKASKVADNSGVSGFRFEGFGELCNELAIDDQDHTMTERGFSETDGKPLTVSSTLSQPQSGTSTVQYAQGQEASMTDDGVQCDLSSEGSVLQGRISQDTDLSGPLNVALELGHSVLYSWPGLERIDMFDADDLEAHSVFVLVVPQRHGNSHESMVYVWLGKELTAEEGSQENQGGETKNETKWQQVGGYFAEQIKSQREMPLVLVVREGQEPEEFWENFNHG